jgi:hypothetical protein
VIAGVEAHRGLVEERGDQGAELLPICPEAVAGELLLVEAEDGRERSGDVLANLDPREGTS